MAHYPTGIGQGDYTSKMKEHPMTNPSVTDQVAEVVKWLEDEADHRGHTMNVSRLGDAARLIATLAVEVDAWRIAKPLSAMSLIDTPIRKARQATDALLAEVKRG